MKQLNLSSIKLINKMRGFKPGTDVDDESDLAQFLIIFGTLFIVGGLVFFALTHNQ